MIGRSRTVIRCTTTLRHTVTSGWPSQRNAAKLAREDAIPQTVQVRTITWTGLTLLVAALGVALLRPFSRQIQIDYHHPNHGLTYNHLLFWGLALIGTVALAGDLLTRFFNF
jgi:hypothetical protein